MNAGAKSVGLQVWQFVAVLALLLGQGAVSFAQTATDPGEGLRAESTATSGQVLIKWWGKAGRSYFMQSSSTLAVGSWSFLPMVEAGGDAVLTFSLTSNEERQFVRLMYTDQFYVGSVGKADFDGDGLSNELEVSVEVRSNPLLADSDNDGVSDGDEVANSNDPNNGNPAPAFGGEAEKNPPQPVVYLATHGMMVENYWFKTDPDSPPVGIYADLSWDDDTIAPGSSTYEEFTPKWSEKWQSLVYPPQAGQDKDFRFNPYTFAGYSKHVFGTNPNLSISGKVSRARERVGLGISYGSKVPWENAIRVLDYSYKKTRNPAAPSNPDVEISEVSFRVLKMDPNKVCTAVGDRVTLEQVLEDNIERYHVLARPDLYMQTGQSFAFDTVSYGTNGPQLWIMLPKDEQRNIGFVSRSQPGVNVFKVVGNVTPDVQLPQPAGPSVIPFVGSQVGDTAYLKMGVSKNYATPGVFPEGGAADPDNIQCAARFCVLPPKLLKVFIHRISRQNGSDVSAPPHVPDVAVLKTYLDSIYLVQANIECEVSLMDAQTVPFDVGLGLPNGSGTDDTINDNRLDIIAGRPPMQDRRSAEEDAILAASAPDNSGVNIYVVASGGNVAVHEWLADVNPSNLNRNDLQSWSYRGWASGALRLEMENVAWVASAVDVSGSSNKQNWIIAHEIGHLLGLGHTQSPDMMNKFTFSPVPYAGYVRHSDSEARLMTGRFGPKSYASPKRLVKADWKKVHESSYLQNRDNN